MKKDYLKPEAISVNMEIESNILEGSIGVSDEPEISAAGKHRGEWGNVWGK